MRVHGLASKPELNGSVGEVEGPALDERVFVRLDAPHNKTVSLKSSNLEELGSSDGRWRVRLERLGDGDAPTERVVSAAAVGALPNWPFLGVSVACLRAFARAHEALLVDATTEDVCERVCKPLTETAGDSLAACLVRSGAVDPVTGVPLAAAPTIFVSHARKYLFRDLVDAVCAHVSSLPEEEHERHYVWLDIFSQYQHWIGDVGTAQRPCNWDVVFQLTTAAIGHTCLVFAPWRDAVPLRRAWMLWEVLCTLTAQGKKGGAPSALRVRLPPAESTDFQAALVNEFDAIAASVARIDSRSAECFTREDQAMVHAAIDRTLKGGHTELDARLSEALREWLVSEGRAALARLPREERATSKLQNRLGLLLFNQSKLDEAEPLLREGLEVQRATLGDRHPGTLASINNLGTLLQAQGKLDEAEPLMREGLKAQRARLGDRHSDTLASMNNLGALLYNQGKLDEAEPLMRSALDARRAMLGDRHSDTLDSMSSLGTLLTDQGKFDEAEPLLREAIEASRATLGDRHPDTLIYINNLGAMLKDQGKLDEAEPLLREALEAKRATLGYQHPHTLNSMRNLESLLKAQGRLDEAEPLLREDLEAEPLLREDLEASRATLGDRHPHTLASIMNLGTLLYEQGKLDEAEPLLREGLEVQRATLGDRHHSTLSSIGHLGSLLHAQGKHDEALPLLVEHCRGTLGDRHPDTLRLMDVQRALELKRAPLVGKQVLVHGLVAKPELNDRTGTAAGWDSERGRYSVRLLDGSLLSLKPANLRQLDTTQEPQMVDLADAQEVSLVDSLLDAIATTRLLGAIATIETQRATLGDRHPDTLTSIRQKKIEANEAMNNEAMNELLCGRLEALEARRATLGDRHPHTLGSMGNLGLLLHAQGKLDEAEPLLREALEARRATLGDRHAQTLISMSYLGGLLTDQGKLDEAEPLLRENLEASRATLGDRHPHTLTSLNNLGLLLHAEGKLDEAEPLLREALEASRATLGDQHPKTIIYSNSLGMLLKAKGFLGDALPLLTEHSRGTLGDRHPDTLKVMDMHRALELKRAPLVGKQVLVHGLVAKPELNDRTGTAAGWDSERGRYSVRLQDGSLLSLKPANLQQLDTTHEPQPGTQSVQGTAPSSSSPDPSAGGLVGEQVLLHGQVAKPELNNRRGTAGWDSAQYSIHTGELLAVAPAVAPVAIGYREGQAVEVIVGDEWRQGRIYDGNEAEGTYDVALQGGKYVEGVSADRLRSI